MATTYRLNHGLVERVVDGVPTADFIDNPVDLDPPVAVPVPDTPVSFTQTYSTTAATVPAATASAVTPTSAAITGGESPTEAEHNATVTDIAALATSNTALIADVLALRKLVNQLIDILQTAGLAA